MKSFRRLGTWILLLRAKIIRQRWIAVASEIFGRTKYVPDSGDVVSIAESMALVELAGLRRLNERLTHANRKVFDTIAEVNLAVMLIRHLGASGIEYEPPNYGRRPIDFRITQQDSVLNLQMKRFGDLERDNRRAAIYERIRQKSAEIDVPKIFGISLKEEFSEVHVESLVRMLEVVAPNAFEGQSYDFRVGDVTLAGVEFWLSKSKYLSHLTLGAASDAGVVSVTGLASDQLRASLRNAAGAFNFQVDAKNLNLVVAESDRHHDIDICEACFGTEEEIVANGRHGWHRIGDGAFAEAGISEKVVGLVALRRLDPAKPTSVYESLLLTVASISRNPASMNVLRSEQRKPDLILGFEFQA